MVYWGECRRLGEHECRCLLNRCENTEQLRKEASDVLLLGVGTPGPGAPQAGGNGTENNATVALSMFETPLTPTESVAPLPPPSSRTVLDLVHATVPVPWHANVQP